MITRNEKTGVVAEYNGKYWGIVHADGQSTSYNWVPIESASISNPEFCHNSTDMTWDPHYPKKDTRYNPDYEELEKAVLKRVRIITVYEVEE